MNTITIKYNDVKPGDKIATKEKNKVIVQTVKRIVTTAKKCVGVIFQETDAGGGKMVCNESWGWFDRELEKVID